MPYIERRDSTSIASLKKTSDLQKAQNELVGVESESLRSGRENVRLTAELLDLIREKNRNKAIEILDESSRAEIDRLEQAVRSSRRKWRVVKGTTSAIVAGSGVDWVKDAELRDIVLDMEDDGV